jgi:hypothetical protein
MNIQEEKQYSPPSLKINTNELQWNGHPTFKLTEMSQCLQDIIVKNFIESGTYGLLYRVEYKNKDCALKIIPIDNIIEPLKGKTLDSKEVENEYNFMRVINDTYPGENVAPKVYLFRTCRVKLPEVLQNETLNIAIIIMELFNYTLYDFMEEKIDELQNGFYKSNEKWKDILIETIEILKRVDIKIRGDLLKCERIGIFNEDAHLKNVMFNFNEIPIISDWGLAFTNDNYSISPFEDNDVNYYYTLKFIEKYLNSNISYLTNQEKEFLNKIRRQLFKFKFTKNF